MYSSRISDIGDDMLKRATSAISLEDPVLIKQLYEIYLGTRGAEGSLPARTPLQTKILSILCRSKLVSCFLPQSSQIIQEALASAEYAVPNGEMPIPKQGLEATKLRGQVFAFTNWLARVSTPAQVRAFAPALVKDLRTYIESQGWPRFNVDNATPVSGELASRAFGYESIGILAGACPEKLLHDHDLDLLRWLFTSLREDTTGKDITASIEQTLSNVLGAFGSELDSNFQSSLTALLLHLVDDSPEGASAQAIKGSRYLAVRFANRCLSFSNTTARWIDIRAMEGNPNDQTAILEEGRKGLHPYWYRMLNPIRNDDSMKQGWNQTKLPSFHELIQRLFGTESICYLSSKQIKRRAAFTPALTFCRNVLLHEALTSINIPPVMDVDWERNIDALIANNEDAREKLKIYFRNLSTSSLVVRGNPDALYIYLQAAFVGLVSDNSEDAGRAGDYFLETCSLVPKSTYTNLSTDILDLQAPIFSTNRTWRDRSSHIFGILASLEECSRDVTERMLKTFALKLQTWQQALGGDALQVHGAILALAYFLAKSHVRGNEPPDFDNMRCTFTTLAFDILHHSRDKMLLDAVFVAISELALFGVLRPDTIPKAHSLSGTLQRLTDKAKEGEEKAIEALGRFAIQCKEGADEETVLNGIVEKLYDLHNIRQPEAQFAVGAALSCAAVGWSSKSLIEAVDVDCSVPSSPTRETTLPLILDQVLLNCRSTKPALRQASVIWLLCLVQYCGHYIGLYNRLRECQAAFKSFLADRDPLNQESASRGLTLVYEKGSKALKDDLIRDLVGSFTENKASFSGSVSQDTELFDPGALPTGNGSITTVRLFCCLIPKSAPVQAATFRLSIAQIDTLRGLHPQSAGLSLYLAAATDLCIVY